MHHYHAYVRAMRKLYDSRRDALFQSIDRHLRSVVTAHESETTIERLTKVLRKN